MLGRDKALPQRPFQQFGWADTEAARQFDELKHVNPALAGLDLPDE